MNKIYTKRNTVIAAILGGPVAASYMVYKNYKTFENNNALKNTIFLCLFLFIFAFITIIFISKISTKLPGLLIPLLQAVVVYKFINEFQSSDIKNALQQKAKKASMINIITTIIIGGFISFAIIIPSVVLFEYRP